MDKHLSLLRALITYSRKDLNNIGPRCLRYKTFLLRHQCLFRQNKLGRLSMPHFFSFYESTKSVALNCLSGKVKNRRNCDTKNFLKSNFCAMEEDQP